MFTDQAGIACTIREGRVVYVIEGLLVRRWWRAAMSILARSEETLFTASGACSTYNISRVSYRVWPVPYEHSSSCFEMSRAAVRFLRSSSRYNIFQLASAFVVALKHLRIWRNHFELPTALLACALVRCRLLGADTFGLRARRARGSLVDDVCHPAVGLGVCQCMCLFIHFFCAEFSL